MFVSTRRTSLPSPQVELVCLSRALFLLSRGGLPFLLLVILPQVRVLLSNSAYALRTEKSL